MIKLFTLLTFLLTFAALAVPINAGEEGLNQQLLQAFRTDLSENVEIHIEKMSSLEPIPSNAHLVSWSPHPPIGLVQQQWEWTTKTGELRRSYATASVKAFARIAIAKSSLRNNEVFTPTNVSFERRELAPYAAAGYFTDEKKLFSLIAYGFVRAGTVLSANNTQAAYAVFRGQIGELVSRQNNLELRAQVKVLKDGRVGEWIPVENTQSRKIIQARVGTSGELTTR